MKQVILKKGIATVDDVPRPNLEPGTVVVSVEYSCISIGTEMSSLSSTAMPLWKRAMKQPDNLKKGLEMIAANGLKRTWSFIEGKIEGGSATGYSAAGTVIEVASDVRDLKVGDRVACAGAQCAHHADVIRVPRNLTVPVPDGVDLKHASSVTLGAIALQGVRRLQPTLGETFVVIGLGILGQITAQLLRANGCRVIGTDLDRSRIALAKKLGMELGLHPDDDLPIEQVIRLTDGVGADGVIITAASPTDAIISQAFHMTRKKGRVVLVGDVGLHLNRADFYAKEIDFLISCSYGPGRYDTRYEDMGLDYPVSHVRWTENRNLSEYLRLIGDGRIQLDEMIHSILPIERAQEAYERLKTSADKPLMVLLSYPPRTESERNLRRIVNPSAKAATTGAGAIGIALCGAGGFAKGMHLPNLQSLTTLFHLRSVQSRTGHNAMATAKQFGAAYGTTDFDEILRDKDVSAVIIATRHDLHAPMALKALEAGKHVLLEKPMAINSSDLALLLSHYENRKESDSPILLTGFNRRFSPALTEIKKSVQNRSNPLLINYRMNAGHIPLDHWVHGREGGGRNIGEACHIYDLFTYLTGSRVVSVTATAVSPQTGHYSSQDNFVATCAFEDGSVATLTYTAMGSRDFPKEQMEVFVDGKVWRMDDYKSLEQVGGKSGGPSNGQAKNAKKEWSWKSAEKGQKEELIAFGHAIRSGGDWPIGLWEQVQATRISFAVENFLRG